MRFNRFIHLLPILFNRNCNLFFVISAAHCIANRRGIIFNENSFEVVVGLHITSRANESQVQTRRVIQIIKNNNYDPITFDSDIALMKLDRDVQITRYVRTVCLPEHQR